MHLREASQACETAASRQRMGRLQFKKEAFVQSPILAPVMALVLWTFVMWAWLYATRIPAIFKNKVVMNPGMTKDELNAQIPTSVRWKADNYNHLLEQPTLFYAVALVLAMLGAGDGLNLTLAWTYVGLRIVHSLVQSTVNIITARFFIFLVGSLVLLALSIRAAMQL
jgi:hypothetical protein